ncbi:hypothetical protein [Bacillus sp. CHD6a]|nr:hypothetical protein [Bacillus sp. CHD6a]
MSLERETTEKHHENDRETTHLFIIVRLIMHRLFHLPKRKNISYNQMRGW